MLLIVLVNPIANESVITRERQEFSPVLVRVTVAILETCNSWRQG
jgi:hypothetical protein